MGFYEILIPYSNFLSPVPITVGTKIATRGTYRLTAEKSLIRPY